MRKTDVYSVQDSEYYGGMKTHGAIDNRSLAMARGIAARIDEDLQHAALARARAVCRRWLRHAEGRKDLTVNSWNLATALPPFPDHRYPEPALQKA